MSKGTTVNRLWKKQTAVRINISCKLVKMEGMLNSNPPVIERQGGLGVGIKSKGIRKKQIADRLKVRLSGKLVKIEGMMSSNPLVIERRSGLGVWSKSRGMTEDECTTKLKSRKD